MFLPTKALIIEALAKTDALVPAPRILGRALHLLQDPESGLEAIAELIRCDAALAVDVLRCANSAYYGRETRIANVGDAVQVIGFRETIRLVGLVAARQATHRDLGSYGISAEDFWAESLLNGLLIEALAQEIGFADPSEAYTTGLLRFVGRLALDQVLHDLGGGLFWNNLLSMSDWERENVGLTQAEAGAWLLRKWDFPESIVLAIERQDVGALPESDADLPLVQAAHFVAQILPAGTGLDAINSLLATEITLLENHPFTRAHNLTIERVSAARKVAHQSFLNIRKTLYR